MNTYHRLRHVFLFCISCCFLSCSKQVKPIAFGHDDCSFCKMTIMDNRYAAEIISRKGKIFMMDDLGCVRQFIESGGISISDIQAVYACNFNGKGELVMLDKSFIVQSDALNAPMQGHEAVFENELDAKDFIQTNGGKIVPSTTFPGVR